MLGVKFSCSFEMQLTMNPGQKTTGQKTTGQKTTKNVNPGQKITRTKDHPDKRPPSWFFYGEILSHLTVYSFIRERVKK